MLIAKTDWIKAHQQDVAAVVKSWMEAVAFYEQHPDEAIPIMAKGVGGWLKDPKDFKDTLAWRQILRRRCQQAVLRHA